MIPATRYVELQCLGVCLHCRQLLQWRSKPLPSHVAMGEVGKARGKCTRCTRLVDGIGVVVKIIHGSIVKAA